MRILKVKFENYRQYRDVEFSFEKKSDTDIFTLIAENDVGKTNFLNGINWCLYGTEPHLAKNKGRPIPNMKAINEKWTGKKSEDIIEVSAELHLQDNNNEVFQILRKKYFTVTDKNKAEPYATDIVRVIMPDGSVLQNDDAILYIDRIVPGALQPIFFFDGEKLDNYFSGDTPKMIENIIKKVANIDVIENAINHLQSIRYVIKDEIKKLTKKKADPNLERDINQLMESIKDKEKEISNIEERLNEVKDQLRKAKDKKEKLKAEIKAYGGDVDVGELLKKLDEIKANISEKKEEYKKEMSHKYGILRYYLKIILAKDAIHSVGNMIKELKAEGKIPPLRNKKLLLESLEKNECKICGRELNHSSREYIKNMIKKLESEQIYDELGDLENYLHTFAEEISRFKEDIDNLNRLIEKINEEMDNLIKEKESIEAKIKNVDKVKELYRDLSDTEKIIEDCNQSIGSFNKHKEISEKELQQLRKQLNDLLEKNRELQDYNKQLSLCERGIKVFDRLKERLMERAKRCIEEEMKKIFFELIWKKETYKDIRIDNDYDIHLIDVYGQEALGTAGSAVRQLLALSFILALHKVSGYDFSILIDTPLGRVSGPHREKYGKVIPRISSEMNKQIILLLTPNEYSIEIRRNLDGFIAKKFYLSLDGSENEIIVKEGEML